jgi:Predicted RNA-binding protein
VIREAIATGDTVELAREAACKELGVETYDAEFEILEMPTKKTFGLFGGSPAKVRVFMKSSPANAAADYVKKVLSQMGLESIEIQITEEENGALLSLTGDDIGFVIGHRGETLDALQYLAGLVANHIDNSYYRITLDIGNYREKRKETLEILGKKMAAKAVKTGRNASLEPMNPYERRIIHTAVQTVEGAKSWSEGEELARHVVIGPEAGERPNPRKNFGRNPRRPGSDRPRYENGPARSAEKPVSRPSAPFVPKEEAKADTRAPLYGRIDTNK